MGLFGMAFGAASGFGLQLYSNAVRKLPMAREPWLHVGFAMIGGYAGFNYASVEAKLLEDVNEMRADRKLPPLERAGSRWFGDRI
eukprot:CAMPEP_0172649026 /NCGR_PEP_ID=MMETSP1068-20121228/241578_1 /TAXON_ID=35684 /ORGANISM="Pseudopedinella elastica, Strain CCMP716" /LENGTH=84 /DNA_ID=CAMNT_0013463371 /DNA_START=485 /DNA_END=739 /DNA_ORIENTATION=-